MRPRIPILQRGDPLARGLIGAWLFYEGAGAVLNDVSHHGLNLGLTGTYSWIADHLYLGGGYAVSPAAFTEVETGAFTVHILAQCKGGDSNGAWISNNSGVNYKGPFLFQKDDESCTPFFFFSGDQVCNTTVSGITAATGVRYLGAAGIELFINGNSVDSAGGRSGIVTGQSLYIGLRTRTSQQWHGDDYAAMIWNRALTPREIRGIVADPFQAFRVPQSRVYGGTLTPPGFTTIRLDWTDNSEHEGGFSIERKTDAGAFGEIDTVAANIETYDNVNVPEGHTYTYRVKATSTSLGDSEYSNTAAETV